MSRKKRMGIESQTIMSASEQASFIGEKQPPLDRRVVRTRKLLRDALIALIEERGYDGLSIQDITDRANLGRTTFYEHYTDKEHLLLVTVKELSNDLAQRTQSLSPFNVLVEQKTISIGVFEHFAAYHHLYRVLLSERGAAIVRVRILAHLADLAERAVTAQLIANAAFPLPSDLLAYYTAGSLFALIIWWLEHDLPFPPEEMGRVFWKLTNEGLPRTLAIEEA